MTIFLSKVLIVFPGTALMVFVYVVLVFLILRFSVTIFNFLSNPKLGHYGKKFDDKVSIIIRKSSNNIAPLQQSISLQDYKNVEVLTAASEEEQTTLALKAEGRYLLFLDSESMIRKGLLNSLLYRIKVFNLRYIVLIPDKKLNTFYDYLLQPLGDFVLMNLLPLRLVRLLNLPSMAKTSSRYLFYDAAYYSNRYSDTSAGQKDERKVETLLSNKMIVSEHKTSAKQISKDLLEIFDSNPFTVVAYLLLLIVGPIILLLYFDLSLLSLPLGLIFLSRVMISFLCRQNPLLNVILHPLQMIALTCLLLTALASKLFTSDKHSES